MRTAFLLTIGAFAAQASAGFIAGPFSGNSGGTVGNPDNTIVSYNHVGADFVLGSFILEGDLTVAAVTTWASEARIRIRKPDGSAFSTPALTTVQEFTGTIHVGPTMVTASGLTGTSVGMWTFEMFESFDDESGPDSVWSNLVIQVQDDIPPAVCGNGVVETGEDCDPPDGVTCDAECHSISCTAPALIWAHSVALHKTGPGLTAEFYLDLDASDNPASRTSEPRDSGLRVLEFQFDQDLSSAAIDIRDQFGSVAGGALTLGPGAFGVSDLGRIELAGALPNGAVYTVEVDASAGPGCELLQDLCVVALVGDFNSNGSVNAADKGEMLGFMFQPITQVNAKYDLQVNGSDSGNIVVSDLGAWTGFFGTTVLGDPCP